MAVSAITGPLTRTRALQSRHFVVGFSASTHDSSSASERLAALDAARRLGGRLAHQRSDRAGASRTRAPRSFDRSMVAAPPAMGVESNAIEWPARPGALLSRHGGYHSVHPLRSGSQEPRKPHYRSGATPAVAAVENRRRY